MTRNPSFNLADWQVRAALDGRLKAIVVPMKEQFLEGFQPARMEQYGDKRTWIPTSNSGKVGIFKPQSVTPPFLYCDVIAGKEAWRANSIEKLAAIYRADTDNKAFRWFPSQNMPRNLCRIWMTVKDVRPVRVGEMTEEDAVQAGIFDLGGGCGRVSLPDRTYSTILNLYSTCWQSRHGKKYPWESNPWAWYYTLNVEVKR